MAKEIIFDVVSATPDIGYVANAVEYGITTQGDSIDELRGMASDAVDCYFEIGEERPKTIRLRFCPNDPISSKTTTRKV